MKCSDIPERPILEFLASVMANRGATAGWSTHYAGHGYLPSMRPFFPAETPDKLVLAKLRQMMRRGVIDGCDCGCRGDWVITAKGLSELGKA